MCAEFTPGQPMEVEQLLKAAIIIRKIIRDEPLARAFPRSHAPIVIKNSDGNYEMISSEFSLIPNWWDPEKSEKKTKTGRPIFATHNARLETIASKPAFRSSFPTKHCLIPIKEFFESSTFGDKFAGHRIRVAHSNLLFAAGIYDEWLNKATGEIIHSFTIVTHIPNKQLFEAGHDRQPVFLSFKDGLDWLDLKGNESEKFLKERNIRTDLNFDIEIERPLKGDWKKNAPTEEDIKKLRNLILS